MAALRDSPTDCEFVRLVSISDGLPMEEDRNDLGKLSRAMFSVMPGNLAELIGKINESDDDKITCIIAEENMGWAFDIADKMGIRKAAFWPAAAALNALKSHLPMLIEAGTIDDKDGGREEELAADMVEAIPALGMIVESDGGREEELVADTVEAIEKGEKRK
ncbi:UDP-glycosyltransferase 83A1-like [Tasmannia lanceolata]|uniref:UDP-glycosyltransferase 83A1-like n=1 Tax=Tasmannia lanceolata TaxID=3420 RepID=UPI004063C2A2